MINKLPKGDLGKITFSDSCSVGCRVPRDAFDRPYYWHCRRCKISVNYKTGQTAKRAGIHHVVKCGAPFYEG